VRGLRQTSEIGAMTSLKQFYVDLILACNLSCAERVQMEAICSGEEKKGLVWVYCGLKCARSTFREEKRSYSENTPGPSSWKD